MFGKLSFRDKGYKFKPLTTIRDNKWCQRKDVQTTTAKKKKEKKTYMRLTTSTIRNYGLARNGDVTQFPILKT